MRHQACYLAQGMELARQMDRLLEEALPGPAAMDLIAPHIDMHRGHHVYGRAYAALDQHQPRPIYIILGTDHSATPHLFAGSQSAYQTPFGLLPIQRDITQALWRACPDLMVHEHAHGPEHSIELQALWISFLAARAGLPQPQIVPLLCGSPWPFLAQGIRPDRDPRFLALVHTLRAFLEHHRGEISLIAGVDLAHQGPTFGDAQGLDAPRRRHLEQRDLGSLRHVSALCADEFWDHVAQDRNQRRICGLAPLYTALRVLKGHASHANLLSYEQTIDPQRNVVSFAALSVT